jgi:transcriptional regulator with XRE-family HTH domain
MAYTVDMEAKTEGGATVERWIAGVRERLRAARLAKGLTHRAAGAAAGLSFTMVTRVESGAREPSLSTVHALCAAYGAPLCDVLCDMPPDPAPAPKPARKRKAKQ